MKNPLLELVLKRLWTGLKWSAVRIYRQFDLLATIGLTLLLFFLAFTPDFLNWNNTQFVNRGGDFAVSYLGSVFYRLDEWRWPIFTHMNLAYPYGISVHGTDGSPLLSFIFKILTKAFGVSPEAQFVGIWTLFSYIMQAWVSVLICRHAFKNKLLIIMGAMFFVSSPIMLHRVFVHINLMPHFVLLFAVLMWLNNRLERRDWWYMALLFSLGFLTCPYFLPMQTIFFTLLIYKKWILEKKISWKVVFKGIVFLTLVSLFWFYMLGMMTNGQKLNSGGWRLYGMNLATFLCPTWGSSTFFGCTIKVDPTNFGFYDYDNYIGLGVLFLFILLFFHVKDLFRRENLRKHWLLTLFLCGSTLFALSPQIRYMETTIITYYPGKVIEWFGDTFRFSGRFFWPVWYLLVFFLLKTAGKAWKYKIWLLLPIALGLQLWDVYPFYKEKVDFYTSTNKPDGKIELKSPEWKELAQKYQNVFVFTFEEYEMAWLWAITYHKNVNNGFLNRPNPNVLRDTETVKQQIFSGYIAPEFKDFFFILDSKLMQKVETLAAIDEHVRALKDRVRNIDGQMVLEYDPDLIYVAEDSFSNPVQVAHRYWTDKLVQVSNHRLYRTLPDGIKDYASILEMNETYLTLQWDNWGIEKFQMQPDGWYHYIQGQ